MKKLLMTFTVLLLCFSSIYAVEELPKTPDKTLLSTSIGTIAIVDSFLVSASPGGISVFMYNDSSQQFEFSDRTYFDIDSVTAQRFDTLLIVDSRDGELLFFSLNHLPEIPYLGSFALPSTIADYVYFNDHLYLSAYFDGILRYDITDLFSPQFVDSSMKGILVTELEVDNQYLYALDEYNGLLRYQLTPTGFGDFIDYLFVPFRAFDFTKIDSLFLLSITDGGVLVGDFNQPAGNNIVDSVTNINQIEEILYTDSLFMFISQREMTVRERQAPFDETVYDISENLPVGVLFEPDSSQFLLLANIDNGVTMFDINHDFGSFEGLTYSGKIQDMYIYEKQLYVSGSASPVNVFSADTATCGDFLYTIYENLINTAQLQHNGDSTFIVYPDFDKLTLLINTDKPDSLLLENSITISSAPRKDMYYFPTQIYDNALLLLQHPFSFDVFTVSDSGYLMHAADWNFIADITTISVKNTDVYITDTKNECRVLHINEFFDKELIKTISMSGTASESVIKGDTLYLFQENELYLFDISVPAAADIDTVIEIFYPVLDAQLIGEHLFCVGYEGISVYDLSDSLPEMIAYGGMSGTQIAVDSNLITITDGNHLHLYRYDIPVFSNPDDINDDELTRPSLLSQNYPNPFNLETSIRFDLPAPAHVELYVYNILGQQVKMLVNETKVAGNHAVSWDGTNNAGMTVSSGMYLYKFVADDIVETKKMMLLK